MTFLGMVRQEVDARTLHPDLAQLNVNLLLKGTCVPTIQQCPTRNRFSIPACTLTALGFRVMHANERVNG